MTTYNIKFDRSRYHQINKMIEWCEKNIGAGNWTRYHANLPDEHEWDVDQKFGYTTFRFKTAKDYSKFLVKWEWANGQNSTD